MNKFKNFMPAIFLALLYFCFLFWAVCITGGFFINQVANQVIESVAELDPNCIDSECLQACLRRLPDISNNSIYFSSEIEKEIEEIELARYKEGASPIEIQSTRSPVVPDSLKPLQEDLILHQQIWEFYQTVFPHDQFTKVSYLIIYTDGSSGETAAQVWHTNGKWQLYVDILDYQYPYATEALVHEYGHVITLNTQQVHDVTWHYDDGITEEGFEKMDKLCPTFFDGIICANKNSYLNQFGELFWSDTYDEWKNIYIEHGNDEDEFYEATEEFYMKYSDQFVTSYAATEPTEDIAESWAKFILSPKPAGDTIAEQKVLFFYQFPELVKTREQIIKNTCAFAIKVEENQNNETK